MGTIIQTVKNLRSDLRPLVARNNPNLANCLLTVAESPGDSFAVATNGRVCAIVPVDCEPAAPNEMAIPAELCKGNEALPPLLVRNGEWRREEEVRKRGAYKEVKTSVAADIPDHEISYPAIHDVIAPVAAEETIKVTIDVDLLSDLAKAISSDGKTITLLLPPSVKTKNGQDDTLFDTRCITNMIRAVGELGAGAIMPLGRAGGNDNVGEACARFNRTAEAYAAARRAISHLRAERKKAVEGKVGGA